MNSRADVFLEQYKALEELLARKYFGDPRRHSSVIMEYLSDVESMPVRDELNLCREMRNLLAHRTQINGEPVLEPSQSVLEFMSGIIAYVKKPPLAIEFATPIERIMTAEMGKKVLPLMREMDQLGYSHVPVIDKGRFIGVFSKSSVFTYMLDKNAVPLNEQTSIYDFRRFLPLKKHQNERFLFIDTEATYPDIKAAFEDKPERSRRLVAIFITETGREDEPLKAMLTPWDVLGRKISAAEYGKH